MNLRLSSLRLPLAPFTLHVDATLRGRVTALFGGSGAGKTTLLEIIAGLRRPVAGSVVLDGETLTDANAGTRVFVAPDRRAIGYVPQDGALFPHMSVRQNLLYGARGKRGAQHAGDSGGGARDAAGAAPAYGHVVEILEIAPLAERAIATLSGGEKRRVALGRALLSRPRLLLLDEPLAGLDDALKERLLPHLRKIRDEFRIPMICVTHAPDEVMALCDEVLVLASGQVARQGAPAGIFAPSDAPRYVLRTAP